MQSLADHTARSKNEALARQASSALYHLTSAMAMGWEAGKTGSVRRMLLAQLVLRHRLLPQDPLQTQAVTDLTPLFDTQATVTTAEKLQSMNLLG